VNSGKRKRRRAEEEEEEKHGQALYIAYSLI